MLIHKQAGNQIFLRSQRTWERPETQVVQERSRDEWLTKGQVQSFFSRLSAISRKKRADQSRECWNLWRRRSALSHSCKKKLRFLLMNVGTRRSKISSTRWAYYNSSGTMVMISASRPTKKYSQNSMWKHLRIFWTVVQILRYKCCSNKYNHRHGEGMQLLPHHTVNGQGLGNCPTSLG